jgi:monolysocardiolipin acyltransferase
MSEPPAAPGRLWQTNSTIIMFVTGVISRSFLYGLSNTRTYGLERFLKLLDEREDVAGRKKGLITGTMDSPEL